MSSWFKSLSLALAIALPALAVAQSQDVPLRIGFQGRLLKDDGTPFSGVTPITFRIYDAATGGNELWSETQTLLLTNGYYATFLGATTSLGTTERPVTTLFNGSDRFLGVTVADKEMTPRQQIASVAYAVRSAHSVHASDADRALTAKRADVVDTGWLAARSVARADAATNVNGGGTVSAATVSARTVSAESVSASAVTAGRTQVTDSGVSTTGTLSASSLQVVNTLHVPGAVVGGASASQVCTKWSEQRPPTGPSIQVCDAYGWSCDSWGDGQCDGSGGVNCGGGTHPDVYVRGIARVVSSRTAICVQP